MNEQTNGKADVLATKPVTAADIRDAAGTRDFSEKAKPSPAHAEQRSAHAEQGKEVIGEETEATVVPTVKSEK